MKIVLKMPRVSMNMEEGTITSWNKKPGESFTENEVLYTVETEKVSNEVEAPCNGKMIEHIASEGEDVAVGSGVCKIEKID
tara:strand:- start:8 stop:250 length:243 start_codon:yes stop_codon:yes gene_type:complete